VFLVNVSANFNVFESALIIEIQFLMNVSAHLMVFEINMHVNMQCLDGEILREQAGSSAEVITTNTATATTKLPKSHESRRKAWQK
jgi:hypothetical protein